MFRQFFKLRANQAFSMSTNGTIKRGAFIVVEGIDRTGKTTQCKLLVEQLRKHNIKAEYFNFPARQTKIGKVIDDYLSSKTELPDEAIHLLFSANRWECSKLLKEQLEAGTTLIVDRYCYSGVAFSAAKGLDIEWCKSSDVGLLKPDLVLFLTIPSDKLVTRKGYGNERYEVPAFQNKVLNNYLALKDRDWEVINADRSIEEIQHDLLQNSQKVISFVGCKPIDQVWMSKRRISIKKRSSISEISTVDHLKKCC